MVTKKNASSEAFSVVPPGLEPGQAEPKSDVLPLHHGTKAGAKVTHFRHVTKFILFHAYFQGSEKRKARGENMP